MRRVILMGVAAMAAACQADPADSGAMPAAPAAEKVAAEDEGDTRRSSYREASIEGCVGGARERVRDPSIRVEEHCECAVDRAMAGKSYAELQEEELSGAYAPIFQSALRQCISEMPPL